MKTKLLKASSHYPAFVKGVYKRYPGLKDLSYKEQYDALMKGAFGWSNFWKINLEKRGDFEVEEILADCESLQKKWAEEQGVDYREEHWQQDILKAQCVQFQPRIFFGHDHVVADGAFKLQLRKELPCIQLMIGWDGIGYCDTQMFAGTELMATCVEFIKDYYIDQGLKAVNLPFGFERTLSDKIIDRPKKYDVSFAGSVSIGFKTGHHQRLKLLSYLTRKTNISLFLNGRELEYWKPYGWSQRQRLFRGNWKEWFHIWKVGERNQGPRFGMDMYQTLADSKIVVNSHIDVAGNKAANIRLFEATGAGACLLTDWKDNITDFFEVDKEIVVYHSPEECIKKIKWLLANPEKREAIAKAGQKRTLELYSFENRVNQFIDIVKADFPEVF